MIWESQMIIFIMVLTHSLVEAFLSSVIRNLRLANITLHFSPIK